MKLTRAQIAGWLMLAMMLVATPAIGQTVRDLYRGDANHKGLIGLSDGSSNWSTISTVAQSADVAYTLPANDGDAGQVLKTDGSGALAWIDTGAGDTGLTANSVPLVGTAGILTEDTLFATYVGTTNAQVLKLGAGTGGGTLALLEGSGGGTNTVSFTAPATLAADIEYTAPNALPTTAGNFWTVSTTGAITQRPAQRLMYSATAASAAHTGATAAETVVMPASADDPETIATDFGDANLEAGNVIDYVVVVSATPAVPGTETLAVNVYAGLQLIGATGDVAIDQATSITLRGTVKVRVTGASGTGIATYHFTVIDETGAPVAPAILTGGDMETFSSFDTTGTNAFAVKLDWGGTTDASDTSAVEDVTVYLNAAD